jgi:hypothetical protein
MEAFVISIFSANSRHDTTKKKLFSSQEEAKKATKYLPDCIKVISVTDNIVKYVEKADCKTSFWKQVMYNREVRMVTEWSELNGNVYIPNNAYITFYEWITMVWNLHKDHIPPKKEELIPYLKVDRVIEDPYHYRLKQLKQILHEYHAEDIEDLCKGLNPYTQIITYIGKIMRDEPIKLASIIDNITSVFKESMIMERNNISYKEYEEHINNVNASIREKNRLIEETNNRRLNVYTIIKQSIIKYYNECREKSYEW